MNLGGNYVFQEETGEKGTKHLQGIFMFKNAVSFKKLKSNIPTAHIEVCRNQKASIRYCSKKETRTGEIYTNIDIEKVLGTGTRKRGPKVFEPPTREEFIKNMQEEDNLTPEQWNKIFPDMLSIRGQYEQETKNGGEYM